jgi:hypothetical protein
MLLAERVLAQIAETSRSELEAIAMADGCVARPPTGAPGHLPTFDLAG